MKATLEELRQNVLAEFCQGGSLVVLVYWIHLPSLDP
jgi:hypothetical protein